MKTSALGISSIAAFLALAPLGAIPASANQQTAPGQIVKNGIAVPADSEVSGLIPIEGVVAVWKSPALSSGLAIVDEVSEPTRGSHRGVRVIR